MMILPKHTGERYAAPLALTNHRDKSDDDAIVAVTNAHKDDGFGVRTKIDVKQTLIGHRIPGLPQARVRGTQFATKKWCRIIQWIK